jgi:hypothetical protein
MRGAPGPRQWLQAQVARYSRRDDRARRASNAQRDRLLSFFLGKGVRSEHALILALAEM